jgi:hypothetical protein
MEGKSVKTRGLEQAEHLTVVQHMQCFKDAKDQLNVSYSLTPAFG